MNVGRALRLRKRRDQSGFTLIELSIVMVVAALLLVPLLRMAGSAVISTRIESTQSALERASEALISFSAVNGGCLPLAADDEGGLPDTDESGVASANPDTGDRNGNQRAGDLPWAELGLTNSFLDGDGLRIQYYVASPYTNATGSYPTGCKAGFKGFQWDASVTYDSPQQEALWVYDYDPGTSDRTLYKIKKKKSLAAGTHPSDGSPDVSTTSGLLLDAFPNGLLQVRRGPDVTSTADDQDDVLSEQNVFILIAPGPNRNADVDRLFSRDSTHVQSTGAVWTLGTNTVDTYIFSSEPNVGASDSANDGDDTLLIMSFTRFKAEMGKHGLNMEPVCDTPC